MAKLYVANATKQNQEFHFWTPETRRPLIQTILPGQQVQIWQEAPRDQLEQIIRQHEIYGIKPASELDRNREYVGLVYQLDKPIVSDRIEQALMKNDEVLQEQALQRRKESAASLDDVMTRDSADAGVTLQGLSVEVREEERPGAETQINEKIEVEREGRPMASTKRRAK